MKFLKKIFLGVAAFLLLFFAYFFYVNRNSENMTFRQKLLRTVYPALMWVTKLTGSNSLHLTNADKNPVVSFYTLHTLLNDGSELNLETLKGRKIMLVNTASDCGYTQQYEALQKLYDTNKGKLIILAFPANDFKEQEKDSDVAIADFCKQNFNLSFPIMKKSVVLKKESQNDVYRWLTHSEQNGWNNQVPDWNFSKYIVDENGRLTDYFGPSVSPMSDKIKTAINK